MSNRDAASGGDLPHLEGLIIGGGISGLSMAYWLGLASRPEGWELWEADSRVGGTIGTDHADGYSVDWGPNGFLDREPLTLRLVEEIGLSASLEPAKASSMNRFIMKHGRLHPVPLSPGAMLGTGLLSVRDKLRIFSEPFVRARRDPADESVYDFAARRIGRGAAESFIDPMVSGIFGGLARELSLPACFPIMREMEQQYGGLVRALVGRQLRHWRGNQAEAKSRESGPAGPGGHLTSFQGGLDLVVKGLQTHLRPIVRLGRPVTRIEFKNGLWEISERAGRRTLARKIICACPTFAAAEMFQDLDPDLAAAFTDIPYAPIVVVATGHRCETIAHALDGFGFLIPRTEGRRTLGSIWTSSIFADRAPAGCVQFRSMLGGAGDPSAIDLSEDELWSILQRELGPLLGISAPPAFLRVYRWQRGIPQYTLGHIERRTRLEALVRKHPGLYLVGNAYYGVGLNDCVKMAYRIAHQIRGIEPEPMTSTT